jgi:predicted dehydrogenase
MKKVVWGVLSTARIGLQKVIPGMQKSAWCDIRAIASRTEAAARKAADALGIERAYGSYEALLADPEIEAIYNPLPNDMHVPLTLAAVRAGKHVLCEKPIAMSAEEAQQLKAVPPGMLVMEAFMVRFHPQWLRVRELVRAGEIGDVRLMQMLFSYFNRDPKNIRNIAAAGGGALYDIGCYPITLARFVFDAEPQRVMVLVDRDPEFGTDRLASAVLDFGGGRQLSFSVSTQTAAYQRVHVCGTKGRIEVQIPVNAPQGAATTIWLDDGSKPGAAAAVAQTLAESDQYGLQGEAFSRAVRGEIVLPWGVDDAIGNMRVLDALFRSERNGAWEAV